MVSNYRPVLEKHYFLDLSSVNRALTAFNYLLENDSAQKRSVCNRLIKDLGCQPIDHPVDAEIYAKALIEQVILNGEDYNPESAAAAAAARVQKIKLKMPELYAGVQVEVVNGATTYIKAKKTAKRVGRNVEDANDKKKNARVIWEANRSKSNGDIAKLISHELKITYANAYYYVSRVFK